MLLMSLGAMAVSITALGGTSIYPWVFLGVLVVAGLIYAFIKQRQKDLEAQIQTNRQLTINFIYNQYETAAMNYVTVVKPHEQSRIDEIHAMLSSLDVQEKNMVRLYNDTVHTIQSSNDTSVFESMKNQFCNDVNIFQQTLAIQSENIKEKLKEEERKNQKMKIITTQDRKLHSFEIRFNAITQYIPKSSEDVIDFDKMKREMNVLKIEEKWNGYVNSYNDLKNDFQMAQDSSQEHQCIADIATLSSDFSKSLDDLKGQVDEIVKKYAITDEGRLARYIKQISQHVPNPCLQNIQNYSLPKQLTFEVHMNLLKVETIYNNLKVPPFTK